MLTEADILDALDNVHRQSPYFHFISLGNTYSYLIDCRLNIFHAPDERWAVAAERLGYNPRADTVMLDISYFGNCLVNLDVYNGYLTNNYTVYPVDPDTFIQSTDCEMLLPDASYWLVRGAKVCLSHDVQEYADHCITVDGQTDGIRVENACRLLIKKYEKLFRATDEELHKSVPADLKKVLVLDEWYHKDFDVWMQPAMSETVLRDAYEVNKASFSEHIADYEKFAALFRQSMENNNDFNQQQWNENRPGSYETWQQMAKVIVTGDPSFYNSTLQPNTHWKNWPESGTM